MKTVLTLLVYVLLFQTVVCAQFKNIKVADNVNPQDLSILSVPGIPERLFVVNKQLFYVSSDSGFSWRSTAAGEIMDSTLAYGNRCRGLNDDQYIVFPEGGLIKVRQETKHSSTTTHVAPFKNGSEYTINGTLKTNGMPGIVCDLSSGSHRGRVYVCWSDEKYGADNKDVFIAFTDNKGVTWTEPILVTYRPNHKNQFMPRMSIDQNNGFLYIVYYDQQNSPDGVFADVYMARSLNGGLLFDQYKLNDKPLLLTQVNTLGNQCGLSTANSIVRPLWVSPETNTKFSAYTAIVDEPSMRAYWQTLDKDLVIEKTFTLTEKTKVTYLLNADTKVTVIATDPLDHTFEKVIFKNKKLKKGSQSFMIDRKKTGLKKDGYTLTFYYNNKNTYVWLVGE